MRVSATILLSVLAVTSFGCEVGPKSGRGLHLPDGDIERGAVAFKDLGCPTCHNIADWPIASEAKRSDVIVELGGEVPTRVETYGELVTSIVNPSHEISRRYPSEQVANGDVSKMKNFNDRMTVAQLIDLTTFLQSRYKHRHEPLYIP